MYIITQVVIFVKFIVYIISVTLDMTAIADFNKTRNILSKFQKIY